MVAWLQPFDFATEVIPCNENVVADFVSRIPCPRTLPKSDSSDDFVEMVGAASESASEARSEISLTLVAIDTLSRTQSQETDIAILLQGIATGTVPNEKNCRPQRLIFAQWQKVCQN